MKKHLLILLFAFVANYSYSQVTVSRYLAVGHLNDTLKVIDTTSFAVLSAKKMTCDSVILGATGLTRHPQTGVYYAMLRFQNLEIRYLCTIDPVTAVATIIGSVGDRFSNIIFLPSGKMLGVTGDGALTSESLFYIDPTNGNTTFIRALGAGSLGEAIAYCPENGMVYHRSGQATQAYENMDTIAFNLNPLPMVNNPNRETFCMLYIGNSQFVTVDRSNNVVILDTAGLFTFKTALSQPYKGLEFLNCTRNITGAASFCAGSSTTLNATAGAIAYQWYKNGILMTGQTSATLNVTSAGKYNCYITDVCGADSLPTSISVTQKALPIVTLSGAAGFCAGGSTLLTGTSGGTSQWYLNGLAINGATSNTFLASTPGLYNMRKTNTNGCSDSAAVGITVVQNPLPVATLLAARNLKCNADNSGSIDISVSNGTAPYTYSWSNGTSTQNLTGLAAGNYEVIVSDSKSCKDTVNAVITEPIAIQINLTSTDVLCFAGITGTATASASGGSGNLIYSWSNGNTTLSNLNLSAGNYTFTASDDSLCSKIDSVVVSEPNQLQLSFTHTDVLCHGGTDGSVNAIVSGGTGTYTYTWSAGIGPSTLSNLSVGVFPVVVSDGNGCTVSDTVAVTEPDALSIALNAGSTSCFGSSDGLVSAVASGGSGNITYSWSIPGVFTPTVNNLSAGYYTLFVSDDNGCTNSDSIEVIQPSALLANITSNNNACFGDNNGSISANATGGAGNYSYSWSTGATTASISNLAAGTYDVRITDVNSCTKDTSIVITEPSAALAIVLDTIIQTLNGQNTGAIYITVSGGTAPYSYSWSNGQTSDTLNNLGLGIYSVVITDANGCSITSPNYTIIIDGISNYSANSAIELFPNPNQGNFQFKTNQKMHLALVNTLNQVLLEMDCEKDKTLFINENLSPGIYFLKGNAGGKIVNYKIAVQE